ncbi:hypothetical protein LR48_Vigan434s000100 [Vigna angularis]|uniref:Uncharacterized protein n=1 Tax=Phaseolus angularis TaxID=3914 RepID=A0A0L9TA91_PHAAN|nr:hypothetical protein LR48_Vigan434s000100 [Vigna angularis]
MHSSRATSSFSFEPDDLSINSRAFSLEHHSFRESFSFSRPQLHHPFTISSSQNPNPSISTGFLRQLGFFPSRLGFSISLLLSAASSASSIFSAAIEESNSLKFRLLLGAPSIKGHN